MTQRLELYADVLNRCTSPDFKPHVVRESTDE